MLISFSCFVFTVFAHGTEIGSLGFGCNPEHNYDLALLLDSMGFMHCFKFPFHLYN